jgi:hypothetical protein
MIRAGVFITYLLGRNPGEERAIELAARFLREYIASLAPAGQAPTATD